MGALYVVGLTGSIGMGKSTIACFLEDLGVPVLHADKVVHQLYAEGGRAVEIVGCEFPSAVVNGGIDRVELSKHVLNNEAAMKKLEALVHPLVAEERHAFLEQAVKDGQQLAVLDIPLLYETGLETEVDAVAVVSCPAETQQMRVMARPGMTEEKFRAILARQVPDEVKRKRADFVIDTGMPPEDTKMHVQQLAALWKQKRGTVFRATGAGA